jgi:hypothetical protein
VAVLPLADDHRAGPELPRFDFGLEQLSPGQRQWREHRQVLQQPGLRARRGQGTIQPPEPGGMGQGQNGQPAAQQREGAADADRV